MLDRVIAWQRQRQEKQRQRQRRSPLYNVGPSDNLDRSWVEAGTPSPSASRTASRISPEILSFMRGARIFGKNMGFCTNQGWGPVFRNRNFWWKIPNQLLSAHLYFSTVIKLLTSTAVAATACFSSMYSIRQISACSTTEEELIRMKNLTSQSKAAFKQELSKQSFNLISFQL